ncbi:MAG: DUF2332 domain-containing protein [Hydrogenophilaceae bacterium]|jgi:hypothetical protein|nr:DUF2332 domain-containing protein [Hydrogenophilaceae bacterium]
MEKILAHFREQAAFCDAYGSPFTGALIRAMADDVEAGGPTAGVIGAWPTNPRADALALRLAGALHYAALSGRDPALAAHYPATRAAWRMEDVWPHARAFLQRERPWTEDFIKSPPQTNETRRSIALLLGFLTIAHEWRGPIETLELGASAGLNLNWDRFAYATESWRWNPQGRVRIDTEWRGPPPPLDAAPQIRSRGACDQNPLTLADPAERLRLKSYIWADQADRLARFDAAADLAVAHGVRVDRADAAMWVKEKLARRARDAATIIYHSIFLQYPPREARDAISAAIAGAGAAATAAAPLYWLRLEPEAVLGGDRESVRMLVDLIAWPGGERRILAETDGHVRFVAAFG